MSLCQGEKGVFSNFFSEFLFSPKKASVLPKKAGVRATPFWGEILD